MREELSLVRKFLPHLALTKSVLSAQHDLLDVIFHHSCFPFFRDLCHTSRTRHAAPRPYDADEL